MKSARSGPPIPEHIAGQIRATGERFGVRNIRVFGSLARGEARPDSDVDLLVEYVPDRGGFAFLEFCEAVETLLGCKVAVVTERSLHPLIRDRILAQAVAL